MKVSVLMGGTSAERDVSLKTGMAVIKACIDLGYTTRPIEFLDDYKSLLPELKNSDIVFNALHGTIGEDGTIQSWLDKNNLPYTGSDSDSSRRCMNKDQSKSIVRENNFLTPDWLLIEKKIKLEAINFPCIVKPNAQGSTFGISMVESEEDLAKAITFASNYDRKILIENYIEGSLAMCTSLAPIIGYDKASELAYEAFKTGKTIREIVLEKKIPVLGICVGMQIISRSSDEGETNGLSWIDGEVKSLRDHSELEEFPLPHMGWNDVVPKFQNELLIASILT